MRGMTRLFHPETEDQRRVRDALLTRALRPDGAAFPVAREYPLVLSPAGARFSYCRAGEDAGTVVAHANLWPRDLVASDGVSMRVGLVGNVATDERLRGKGLMAALLQELEESARGAGLKALLLWSDLDGFYQKQGFRSCGREYRATYPRAALPPGTGFRVVTAPPAPELERLMRLRPRLPATLYRSAAEFGAQLGIPATTLVAGAAGYAVVGKGCDMEGVAHEWGGEPAAVLAACRVACEALGLAEILVLSPRPLADAVEHPMCWAKTIDNITEKEKGLLGQAFVWGLDSI